jgi:uncharacterized protein
MFGEFWVNLPVKDVLKTSEFYAAIGFEPDFEHGGKDVGVKFVAGSEGTVAWFYAEKVFENFARIGGVNTKEGAEVLLSIYVENRENVDEIASKVIESGGTVFAKPEWAFDWLYGCGIADLDGHRWSILYKDESKMPKN